MNFLDKNGFRAALVIAVIFLAMPFMFPERVPVNVKGSAEDSSQPVKSKKFLTGVYERIGNFYNFKKNKKSALDLTLEQLKNQADAAAAEKKSADAAAQNSFEKAAEGASSSAGSDAGGSSFETGSSSSKLSFSAAALKASSKPKLSIGGKEYEVVKDLYGKDYAITGKGPVAVSSLLAKGGVLKYPSGKTVSSSRVSAEAYNAGGGANPYSSLTASSKASGGSYKGGKRSGGVASTRKISSGFSLSGGKSGGKKAIRKSSGARGDFGDFTGAVDIEDAYNNVQSQAVAVKAMQQADSLEDSYTYYDAAAPASARAAVPASAENSAINYEFVYSEPMFDENTKRASVKQIGTDSALKADNAEKGALDLNQLGVEKEETKADAKVAPKTEVKVKVDFSQGDSVIPGNDKIRENMTKALLGDNVEFASLKTGGKGPVKDPWLVPTEIPDGKFSYAFWQKNQAALSYGTGKFSDPEVWSAADKNNIETMKPIIKQKILEKGPVTIIVKDGGKNAEKDNYFQQQADFLTDKNSKEKGIEIYAVPDQRDVSSIKASPYVFVYDRVITPEHNKYFAKSALDMIESVKREKSKDDANKNIDRVDMGPDKVRSKAIANLKNLEGQMANTVIIPPASPERPIKK